MTLLRRSPLTAALLVGVGVLGGIFAIELAMGGPRQVPLGGRKAVPAEAKLLPPLAVTAPEQAFPETAGRPLFTPTRRPAPEVVATAQPTMQRGQFVLLGVTIAGDTRIAMLREKSTGRLHRIERGRDINGMKVSAIEPDSVVLALGAEQEQLPLTVQRPGATPGAPGQPAAPGAAPPAAAAQGGPFAAAAPPGSVPGAPPVAATPGNVPGSGSVFPSSTPRVGAPVTATTAGAVAPQPGAPAAGAAAPAAEQALSPEEILARRRARRAQQNQ